MSAKAVIVTTSSANTRLADNLAKKKIPSLDGLRAVAVLLVILNHLEVPYVPDGRGVLTFFVLSGFLITWILLKESERYGDISVRDFYVRRVLRIFPAFYVFWILHFVAFLVTRGRPSGSALADYLSSFFYVSNYRHALSHNPHQYMAHTWALSVEEQFYLIWPWIFTAFRKNLRMLSAILLGLIVLVDIYRIVLFFGFGAPDRWLHFTFESRADHLLVGCLLAVTLKRGVLAKFWTMITSQTWISLIPFTLILGSIALSLHQRLGYKYAVGFVIDPWLTAVFLVQVMAFSKTWVWGWLNWRVTTFIGQVSYSMFLYHVFTNDMTLHFLGHRSKLIIVPVAIVSAVCAAACSYYLIELRFLRLKSLFTGRKRTPPAELVAVSGWAQEATGQLVLPD